MKSVLSTFAALAAVAAGPHLIGAASPTVKAAPRRIFLKPSTSPDLQAWMLRRNLEIDSYRERRKEAHKGHRALKSRQPIADFLTECGISSTLDAHLTKAGLSVYVEPKNIVTKALAAAAETSPAKKARAPRKPKAPGSEPVKLVRKPAAPKDPSAPPRVRAPRKAKVAP